MILKSQHFLYKNLLISKQFNCIALDRSEEMPSRTNLFLKIYQKCPPAQITVDISWTFWLGGHV